MKKMAKVLAGIMVLTALVGVVGCSSSDATTDTEATTAAAAE